MAGNAGRRLHDFDRRWFWALIPFGFGLGFGFVQGLSGSVLGGAILPPQLEAVLNIAVTLIVFVTIGSVPGSRTANRSGLSAPVNRGAS
jgi:uncharacterized membrane protein YhaH (DUF805 family)